jgi:hypothetical protein
MRDWSGVRRRLPPYACATAIAKNGLRASKTLPKQTLAFLPWSVNESSVLTTAPRGEAGRSEDARLERHLREFGDRPSPSSHLSVRAYRPAKPHSANYHKLVRNHTCMGCLGSHYREAFRAAATCVMRAP